jgi:hypothetical protein
MLLHYLADWSEGVPFTVTYVFMAISNINSENFPTPYQLIGFHEQKEGFALLCTTQMHASRQRINDHSKL